MNRIIIVILIFFIFSAPALSFEKSAADFILASSSIDRQISRINYEISKNKKEISRIKASKDLSYNEKKHRIKRLEYEIYRQKRAIMRIQV